LTGFAKLFITTNFKFEKTSMYFMGRRPKRLIHY
jgi:hypothetical protein